MQETETTSVESRLADPDSINVIDYLEILTNHIRMIFRVTLVAFVLSVGGSLLLPNIYSSTALILPPQQDQGLMGMMMGQVSGGMANLAGDLLGKGSSADMYVSCLNSQSIADAIIDRFKLMQTYGETYRVDTYKRLDKNVDITAGKKDGLISISVSDEDPKRAAAMANAYVEELSKLAVRLNVTGAGENKTFIESRLAKAKADLASAEDAIKKFQSRNKVVSVNDQASAAILGIAQLKAQLVAQEVQLAALRRQFTDSSQEVKNARVAIDNLRGQLSRLEGSGSGGAIPNVGAVPELGEQYLRLMRDFKIQEALVELLTKQFELANLSQAKDVAGVQIVQRAQVPDKKVKPKRALIVLATTVAASFLASLYAFLCEAGKRMPDEDRKRLEKIKQAVLIRKRNASI